MLVSAVQWFSNLTKSPSKPGRKLSLPAAIRPTSRSHFQLQQGYRYEVKRNDVGMAYPVLTVAISEDRLIELYLTLIEALGENVSAILESSHDLAETGMDGSIVPVTCERDGIDLPILQSLICEYETLLLEDGCTGIATLSEDRCTEVHLDEHKLIYIYGQELMTFQRILDDFDLARNEHLALISEIEHIHFTNEGWFAQFQEMKQQFGAAEWDSELGWAER